MCGKSQSTNTSSQPNPQAMAAYSNLLGQASNVAQLPFQTYGGEFTAPINQQQQTAGAGINQYAGFAQPYIQQAAGYANQAAQPLTASNINQYLSPYTQDVVNATEAQFNNQNAQQLNMVRGNAAAQGALGGDREGIAEGITAGQQSLAQAPVIAGLYNQGYNTALSTAQQQQQNLGQAAYSLGNLGVAGQNAGLTGAGAELGYGTLQQSTQQAQDQAVYQQFLAQQGYPFQVAQWLAGITTGVGSQMGGTSQTTGPAPNPWSQFLGAGIGAFAASDRRLKEDAHKIGKTNDGQPIYRYRYKGSPQWQIGLMAQDVEKRHPEAVRKIGGFGAVDYKAATEDSIHRDNGGRIPGFQMGGMPYASGASYVPTMNLTPGQGAPKPPGLPGQGQQQMDPSKLAMGAMNLEKKIQGLGSGGLFGSGDPGLDEVTQAGAESGLSPGELGLSDYGDEELGSGLFGFGGDFRRGGRIAGFADGGGDDSFDDRFNASTDYGSRSSIPTYPRIPYTSQEDMHSLGDIGPGTDFAFNPVRTNGNRTYGPDASDYDLPPSATAPATGAPSPPAESVPGLAGPPMADTNGGYHPRPMSYAAAPELAPQAGGEDTGGKQSGLGGILSALNNPLGLSPEMRKAMMAAGFSMMASRSPYLGNAIGEGGLAGLSAYSGAKKEEFNEEKATKQLQQHAEDTAKKLALDTKKLAQQEEHLQLQREQAQQAKIPSGYERVEGGLKALPGGPADPEQVKKLAEGKKAATADSSFDDNTLTKMADQYLAGDKGVLVNLGRGAQGATDLKALRRRIVERMDEHGITPAQQAVKMQEFAGLGAGERALGTRTAQIEMAANEARNMMKPALEAAAAVPRTNFVPVNKLIESWQTGGVSDPAQARFAAANFSLVNTYVRAIAPTGVPPESARNHALQMLSGAMSHESYKAVIDQMNIEMDAALKSPGQVMEKFRELHGGTGAPGGAAPSATTPAVGGPAGGGAKPATVRQNGHTYQLQPDGNYKAIE